MASFEDVTKLRGLTNELDDSNGWTDERLGNLIDTSLTLNAAASHVWLLKAGQYATLVDVSESGSSRKLSDLRKNAMEMVAYFKGLDVTDADTSGGRPIVQRIRRGFV
jgi:hypothetical protein